MKKTALVATLLVVVLIMAGVLTACGPVSNGKYYSVENLVTGSLSDSRFVKISGKKLTYSNTVGSTTTEKTYKIEKDDDENIWLVDDEGNKYAQMTEKDGTVTILGVTTASGQYRKK